MKKNDKFKKLHFWILAGLVPLLALLTLVFLMTGPGEAKDKAAADIKTKFDAAKGTNPPGKKKLEQDFPKQTETLSERRKLLWEANYNAQKGVFDWPESRRLNALEEKYDKFGEPMATPNQEFDDIKSPSIYEGAYDRVAEAIKPTTFPRGTWKSALRYVSNWTAVYPTSDQVWLALEDLWVQKGLLLPVKEVNDNAARFELLKLGPDGKPGTPAPLKRTFQNRIWKLELEVPTTGPNANKAILARLTNRTDRLQMLGYRNGTNQMTLNVWLSKNAPGPVRYIIQKDFAKAGETIAVETPLPNQHTIPAGTDVQEITRVEQVLDERTVPVRQVMSVDLGYKDARHNAGTLVKPSWWPEAVVPEGGMGADGMGMPGGEGMGMPGGEGMGMPGGVPGGMPGGRGMGMPGMGGMGTQVAKSGPPFAVLNANANRYVVVTDQVRRMPVAVVLLVDQMFIQDALVAYANSPLRFQITQYHWTRFRGSLSSGMSSMYGGGMGGGFPGFGGFSPEDFGGEGMGSPDGGYDYDGGSSYSVPGSPGGMMPGSPGGMMGGMLGGTSGSISEGQITSGLVELTLYGVITLYNKYEVKAAEGEEASPEGGAATTPEGGAATPETAAPGEAETPDGEAAPTPKEPTQPAPQEEAAPGSGDAPAPKDGDPPAEPAEGAPAPKSPTPPKGDGPEAAPPGTPKN